MDSSRGRWRSGLLLWLAAISLPVAAKEYAVADQSAYKAALRKVEAGDSIVLNDGEWRDFQIVFEGLGTAERPITLTAQTKGKVFITGQSNLRLAGEYLVVSGLVFRDGHTPSDDVIEFRRSSRQLASHSRLTEVVIDRFNQPERSREDRWVSLHGQFNRVDHSQFVGKTNAGVTLAVIRQAGAPLDNQHRIDHSYFGFRPPLGANGGETIRIGTSEESLSDSHTLIESNYFEHCDGEVEIVSNKSGGNTFRNNTFFESQGSLVLRHGNGNLVEGNVFFGNGKPHTGGIRVINAKQTVRGNYMEGLAGTGFASAFAVMNGVPNSVINRYHQVNGAVIENNTVIDASRILLGAGADAERSAPPINSRFDRNLIVNRDDAEAFVVETDISGIAFAGNVQNAVSKATLDAGFARQTVTLERASNGLLYAKNPALANVGAPKSLQPVTKQQTGVEWYAKPADAGVAFDSGKKHPVATAAALSRVLAHANDGDTLQLAAGEYVFDTPIVIDRVLSIVGPTPSSLAKLRFKSSSLFTIAQGGKLRLQNLQISGAEAPAAVGNVVFGFASKQQPTHYAVEIVDCDFIALNRAPGFDVIAVTPASFAQRIEIRGSSFNNVSGAVIATRARDEGDPSYGVERVEIAGSRFIDVARVADIFRGGKDESTFGPRFVMTDSTVVRSEGSIRLAGVLFTRISGNRFGDSGPVEITHGVGAPRTDIVDNSFSGTPEPVVRELHAKGAVR